MIISIFILIIPIIQAILFKRNYLYRVTIINSIIKFEWKEFNKNYEIFVKPELIKIEKKPFFKGSCLLKISFNENNKNQIINQLQIADWNEKQFDNLIEKLKYTHS